MTLHTSTRIVAKPVPEVAWWRAADGFDHAFATGAGFMRSRCAAVRWTVALVPALAGVPSNACRECDELVNGTEGEKAEAYGS